MATVAHIRQSDPLHPVEAEQSILGALMLDNRAYHRVRDLRFEDFSDPVLGKIFERISAMLERGDVVDVVSAGEQLEEEVHWSILADITQRTPSAAGCDTYAAIIRERAACRRALGALVPRLDELRAGKCVIADAMRDLQASQVSHAQTVTIDQALDAAEAQLEREREASARGELPGVSTTIPEFDRLLRGGLRPSKLLVIGGRTGEFKSTLAWQMALEAARSGTPTGVFSLEMLPSELGVRAIRGDRAYRGAPLVLDKGSHTPDAIRTQIANWAHRHGTKLFIVDHLQRVRYNTWRRREAIGDFVRALKNLALDLEIAIVAASQLNRENERRDEEITRWPRLADLKEAGDIEEESDAVIFSHLHVWRGPGGHKDLRRQYYLILAKNRDGIGKAKVKAKVDGARATISAVDDFDAEALP